MGDDRTINFWTDIWLPPAPLIEFANPSTVINTANKVFRFWDFNGWNLALLSSCLPDDIVGTIISVPPGFEVCGLMFKSEAAPPMVCSVSNLPLVSFFILLSF